MSSETTKREPKYRCQECPETFISAEAAIFHFCNTEPPHLFKRVADAAVPPLVEPARQ